MKLWSADLQTDARPFMDENYLLHNRMAEILYHDFARDLPIIDYHCHLPPDEIATDKQFANITEVWLNGDHYKWRAMRTLGIGEEYITGDTHPYEKFSKWAYTVPFTIRNPLYQWTHLELRRYFGIHQLLSPSTAKEIYDTAGHHLNTSEYSTRGLLQKMRVEVVCTTDDPADDLHHHRSLREENTSFRMLPAFRPDKAIHIESDGFEKYIEKLGSAAGHEIQSFDDLLEVLRARIHYFDSMGCVLSDHGLEEIYSGEISDNVADKALRRRLGGKKSGKKDARTYKATILYHLARMYHEYDWVQQFHLGALRNNSSRMRKTLGPDTGFDSIGDFRQASGLARFLDNLDKSDRLARTVLYNLNPSDNEVMATMAGNFNDGSVKGKIQFGSAWWFLDQKDGIEKQLNALSNMGILSCFIGMLTDSRSFMSFPRHEYFRRILCNIIGADVHAGELPGDVDWLGKIVRDICYHNARAYFGFDNDQNS